MAPKVKLRFSRMNRGEGSGPMPRWKITFSAQAR
jgi:hypothetical protein